MLPSYIIALSLPLLILLPVLKDNHTALLSTIILWVAFVIYTIFSKNYRKYMSKFCNVTEKSFISTSFSILIFFLSIFFVLFLSDKIERFSMLYYFLFSMAVASAVSLMVVGTLSFFSSYEDKDH